MRSPGVAEVDSELRVSLLACLDVVFVPGDPPRAGRFALVGPGGTDLPEGALGELSAGGGPEHGAGIELVMPVGGRPRRKVVAAAILLPGGDPLTWGGARRPPRRALRCPAQRGRLVGGPRGRSHACRPGAAPARGHTLGLRRLARGTARPRLSPARGRARRSVAVDRPRGPALLERASARLLAARLRAGGLGRGGRRARANRGRGRGDGRDAVRRERARRRRAPARRGSSTRREASMAEPPSPSASRSMQATRTRMRGAAPTAGRPPRSAGPSSSSRAGPTPASSSTPPTSSAPPPPSSPASATTPRRSSCSPSAEGSASWPRLEPLLRERIPAGLDLDDDVLRDLLGEAAPALASAGIEVFWPTDLLTDGLALRAEVVGAPEPMVGGDSTSRPCSSSGGSSRWGARPSTKRRSPSSPRPSGASFACGVASSRPTQRSWPAREPAGPSGCRPPRRSARSSPGSSWSTARSCRCERAVRSPGSPNGSRPSPPDAGRACRHRRASRAGSARTSDAAWHGCTRCASSGSADASPTG